MRNQSQEMFADEKGIESTPQPTAGLPSANIDGQNEKGTGLGIVTS